MFPHLLRYAGWAFRLRSGAGSGAAHGFIDNVLGHISQLAVLRLAHRPQLGERVLGAAPGTSADEADRLIDHRAGGQRRLQLDRESKCVREDLRVVHSDSRWFGEQLGGPVAGWRSGTTNQTAPRNSTLVRRFLVRRRSGTTVVQ